MRFWKTQDKLFAQGSGELIQIEPWGQDCLRFRSSPQGEIENQDWTLLPQPRLQPIITITSEKALIKNGKIIGEIMNNGSVRYFSETGQPLIEELWIDFRINNADVLKARNYQPLEGSLYKISLYFKAYENEKFYGMGQYANDCLNLKGCVLELAQKNTQVSIPFLISTRGYGFIWNNPAIGRAELARNWTSWHAEAAKQIDYLIIYGETPQEIVKKYMDLTGYPSKLPEWALGFWQSKLRYRTQAELLEVAREYKKRGLPLSVIVIDFFHWPHQGDWKFDPEYWPDPQGMVEELSKLGVHLMVSIWPTVEVESENYQKMVERGLLVKTKRGPHILSTFRGFSNIVDFTNPKAREYVWKTVKENYYKYGIKHFWLDQAEPEFDWSDLGYSNLLPYQYDNLQYYLGDGLQVSNIFPFFYAKAFYDNLQNEGEKDVVNLIRSAWIGSQRLGVIVWSGDIPSTFDSLRRQIKAGLNMAMAGIPWWATDIGGFYGGDPQNPRFKELIVRWFQFGVFCPICRLHGFRLPYPRDWQKCAAIELTGGPNEIWSFGEEIYKILKFYLLLREKLKPYIIKQMQIAHEEGIPIMRPLFFDFPHDEVTYEIEDEYMFGPDILVAPVFEEGARARKVYLPKGACWKDPYTGKKHIGGSWIEYNTPLEIIPIFLRNEAQLPVRSPKMCE